MLTSARLLQEQKVSRRRGRRCETSRDSVTACGIRWRQSRLAVIDQSEVSPLRWIFIRGLLTSVQYSVLPPSSLCFPSHVDVVFPGMHQGWIECE